MHPQMMRPQTIMEFFFLVVAVAYLVGSIPFGLLLGLARGVDIRRHGSGNIGATNAGRVLGMRFFWIAFFLDFLKGFLPVLLSDLLIQRGAGPIWIPLAALLAAVAGHLFPIYLKFRGGKGVATGFGAVLGIWPIYTIAALGAVVIFLLVFALRRIISLSSLAAVAGFAVLVPLAGRLLPPLAGAPHPLSWSGLMPLMIISWVFSFMVIWKHRSNIRRLLAGTEPRLDQRHESPANSRP